MEGALDKQRESGVHQAAVKGFKIKDSGKREEFASGMVRDTTEGKVEYARLLDGPMLTRWAEHLTKGAAKYPDLPNGHANWTLANGEAELRRFRDSAFRHFIAYMLGETDEDHAAALFFNINGAEYVKAEMDFNRTMEAAVPGLAPRPRWPRSYFAAREARHDAETLDRFIRGDEDPSGKYSVDELEDSLTETVDGVPA